MLTCCIVLPFTCLGLAVTKRPIYMLPLYPFLSLFVACYLDARFLSNRFEIAIRPWIKALRFACPIVLGAGIVAGLHFAPSQIPADILTAPPAIAIFFIILALSYA